MKKKITAIICAICAFVCAFSLTACGGGGDGWTTTGTLNKDENGNVIFDNVEIILATVFADDPTVQYSVSRQNKRRKSSYISGSVRHQGARSNRE